MTAPRTGVAGIAGVLLLFFLVLAAGAGAAPVNPVDVVVTISHVHQLNEPDIDGPYEDADFYAKVKIGPGDYQETGDIEDDGDIYPNWQFGQPVYLEDYPGGIPVWIQMWDSDIDPDDPIDINPDPNYQVLLVYFDPWSGTWHGYTDTGYARGDNGDQAEIWFSVDSSLELDTDEDGIPDTIEMNGLQDKNGNLLADLKALGADPCRKTIGIELDYMGGAPDGHTHRPADAAITEAVAMFDEAPVNALPDGVDCPYPGYPLKTTGVDLLVKIDEQVAEAPVFGCGDFTQEFKNVHLNPLLAKIFHYSLWVHDHAVDSSSSGVACGGGRGDFLVSLGSWCTQVDAFDCPVATQNAWPRAQAGTLNHELGHTIGLGHGGGDGVNYKPNYLSIMSYRWQVVGLTDSVTGETRLDFSDTALPTLMESGLDEGIGIQDGTLFTSWIDRNLDEHGGVGTGPLDWSWDDRNNDGDPDNDTGVTGDLNWDSVCVWRGKNNVLDTAPAGDDVVFRDLILNGPDRTCDTAAVPDDDQGSLVGEPEPVALTGYDDWENIVYGGTTGSGGGAPPEVHDEATLEEVQRSVVFWREFLTPDVAVEKTVDHADALPGDELHYTVTITNAGNVPMTGITVMDTLPDGTVLGPSPVPDLEAGESTTVSYEYTVPTTATDNEVVLNTAEVSGTDLQGDPDDEGNNIATATTIVHTPVLGLGKSAAGTGYPGEAITYTITYENTGGADALDLVFTDTLPSGVYYSRALDTGTGPAPGTVTGNPDGTTTLAWTFDSLPAHSGPRTIVFTARPTLLFFGGETLVNAARLSFTDANGNTYPEKTAEAPATLLPVVPGRSPRSLGYYRNHPAAWTGEILARVQATDTRFDGADGSSPDGMLSAGEVKAVLAPGGNQPKVLLMQLLAAELNLATREIGAGTGLASPVAGNLGLTTVRDAVLYGMDTLRLPVTNANRKRYSDATTVLDDINNGKYLVY